MRRPGRTSDGQRSGRLAGKFGLEPRQSGAGEVAALYGSFKRARAELGVQSFGMQVIDLPPSFGGYPNHDHTHDDQEEVFLALRGSGELEIDGERMPLDARSHRPGRPAAKRKVWSGPDGIRLLVLGGIPGRAYAPPAPSEIGGPEPKLS